MSEVLTSVNVSAQTNLSEVLPINATAEKVVTKVKRIKPALRVKEVGNQSWTSKNLVVKSDHNNIRYYTTRWDALCPYIEVTEEMLDMAPKPFVVYAIPPDSPFGVPINDKYGLVNVADEGFWADERRIRKFKELDKQYRTFEYSEEVIPGYERNREFKNKSPGIYACLLASRWAAKNGYKFYNLGPVDDYGYKSLFVTEFEPIYALAITDMDHPLVLDPTSPINIDFKPHELNQIYRTISENKYANSAG